MLIAGDKELVEFLKDEIKMEKSNKSAGKLPKIKGFEIIQTDGPNVTLKKTLENERFKIPMFLMFLLHSFVFHPIKLT